MPPRTPVGSSECFRVSASVIPSSVRPWRPSIAFTFCSVCRFTTSSPGAAMPPGTGTVSWRPLPPSLPPPARNSPPTQPAARRVVSTSRSTLRRKPPETPL
jgi:hypothetical protein